MNDPAYAEALAILRADPRLSVRAAAKQTGACARHLDRPVGLTDRESLWSCDRILVAIADADAEHGPIATTHPQRRDKVRLAERVILPPCEAVQRPFGSWPQIQAAPAPTWTKATVIEALIAAERKDGKITSTVPQRRGPGRSAGTPTPTRPPRSSSTPAGSMSAPRWTPSSRTPPPDRGREQAREG